MTARLERGFPGRRALILFWLLWGASASAEPGWEAASAPDAALLEALQEILADPGPVAASELQRFVAQLPVDHGYAGLGQAAALAADPAVEADLRDLAAGARRRLVEHLAIALDTTGLGEGLSEGLTPEAFAAHIEAVWPARDALRRCLAATPGDCGAQQAALGEAAQVSDPLRALAARGQFLATELTGLALAEFAPLPEARLVAAEAALRPSLEALWDCEQAQGGRQHCQAEVATFARAAQISAPLRATGFARQQALDYERLALDLGALDVDLQGRLSPTEYVQVMASIRPVLRAVQECQLNPIPGQCGEVNQGYVNALLSDPVVARRYFAVQGARLALFPRAALDDRNVMSQTPLLWVALERLRCLKDGVSPCPFEGLPAAAARVAEAVRTADADLRVRVQDGWPTDPETLAWVDAVLSAFSRQVPAQGQIDIMAQCGGAMRSLSTWDEARAFLLCVDGVGATLLSANPVYLEPGRLLDLYEDLRARRAATLAEARDARFVRRLGLLGAALVVLMLLAGGWCLLRRLGGRGALTVALAVAAIGGALGVTFTVRHGIEVAFASDPGTRVHGATFQVLMSDEMRGLVSRQTEAGLDLVRTPLLALTPLPGRAVAAAAEVPVVPGLLRHWAHRAASAAEQFAARVARRPPDVSAAAAALEAGRASYDEVAAQARRLSWIAWLFEGLLGLIQALPLLLMLIALGLFLWPLRARILGLALAGEESRVHRLKQVVGAELRSLVLFAPALLLLIPLVGELLSGTLAPLIRLFVRTALRALLHLSSAPSPSGAAVALALGSLLLLVAACVALYVVAFASVTAQWQRVARARHHAGRPLAVQRWLWTWGLAGLAWALAFPLLASHAVSALAGRLGGFGLPSETVAPLAAEEGSRAGFAVITAGELVLWPLLTLGVMLVLAFATRAVRAIARIRAFNPEGSPG